MVRILHVSSFLALIAAAAVSALCVRHNWQGDPDIAASSVMERFKQAGRSSNRNNREQLSPLVQQAQIFAAYLNPPPPPKRKPSSQPTKETKVVAQAPEIRPASTSPKFKLHGISYRPAKPEESMALVWEPDVGHRWVKEGAQLGHIVLEKIKPGEIEYRTDEQIHTMLVDPEYATPTTRPNGGKMLALREGDGGKPDRTVATNTALPRKGHESHPVNSGQAPARTSRPPMRRYRLGR